MSSPIDEEQAQPVAPTPDQIIAEAKRIINTAPDYGPYRPDDYANALPPAASELAGLLRSRGMKELVEQYHDADRRAILAQTWNNLLTQAAALAGVGAGVLGGVYLLLDVSVSPFSLGVGTIPFCLLAVALICLLSSFLFRPLRIWKVRRLEAEKLRLAIFNRIVGRSEKPGDGLPLALNLECFRRHLFEDQMIYFKRRSKDKQREARFWKGLGWFAATLTVLGSSIPQALAFITVLGDREGWFYDVLRFSASLLPTDRKLYAVLWFVGLNLAALATLLPMIYRSSDLAKTYRREFRFLKRCKRHLADARDAAATRQWASMYYLFPQLVLNMLLEGVEEWASQEELPDMMPDTTEAPLEAPGTPT
jgi:hypothetical protein